MTKRTNIVPNVWCRDTNHLDAIFSVLQVHGFITAGQNKALQVSLKQHLPATLTVEQRDKKGATYARINEFEYTVNNRARVFLPTLPKAVNLYK
jgi:hypothetical protein